MHKPILILISLIFSLCAAAQEIIQKVSPEFNLDKNSGLRPIYGQTGNKIYAERFSESTYIDVFSTDLKLTQSIKLSFQRENLKLTRIRILILNNKIIQVASGYDQNSSSRAVFGKIVDPASGSEGSWQKLVEITNVEENEPGLNFRADISPDSNSILLMKYQQGTKNIYPAAYVFNQEMDLKFQKEFKELEYDHYTMALDNYNNIFITGTDGKKITDFYTFTKSTGQLKKHDLNIGESFISNPVYKIINGIFIATGFYNSVKTGDKDGIVYITIDPVSVSTKTVLRKFSHEFLLNHLSEKLIADGEGLNKFEIIDFKVFQNGDVVIVGESMLHQLNNINGTYSFAWAHLDIMIVKFNPTGENTLFINIPKNQFTYKTLPANSSYLTQFKYFEKFSNASIISQNSVNLFYNDLPENITPGVNKRKNMGANDATVVCLANADLITGKVMIRQLPFNIPGAKEFAVIPMVNSYTPTGELLMLATTGKEKYHLIQCKGQ